MGRKRGNGEGSIYHRKSDGKWVGSITLSNNKRKVVYGNTKKEVTEKLIKLRREQQQGMIVTAPDQTVEQFLMSWLQARKSSVRVRTYEKYEGLIRLHVTPAIGKVKLQKLTAQHIQSLYAKKLEGELSSTTVNTLHFMLHKALDDAVKWELVARNVCDAVSVPRRKHYEAKPLTIEQAQVLLSAAEGHPLQALWVLALTTGMRRGEILALKWRDIDFNQNQLQVRRIFTREPGNWFKEAEPKTAKGRRRISLVPLAVEVLKKHRVQQLEAKLRAGEVWKEQDLVFCSSLGTPLNPNWVLDKFKALLKKAGLPDIRFHDLRHSTATVLLSLGINPKVVQEILGHSQISMTMDTYSSVLPGIQEEAMQKLYEALMKQEDGGDDGGLAGAGVRSKPKK